MTFDELRQKAHELPLVPGVYLMQNKANQVIYVGKAKKLRNRVSQYFVDASAHSIKTRMMVSQIDHFDVIVAASEFEALVLECSLIKRHAPKYNILLKDDKGYPYLRIDMREEYPVMTMSNKVINDGAEYFGPFGGRYVTQQLIDTIRLNFKLPGCGKQFPRDIGKARPCLNYHMKNCDAWCRACKTSEQYREVMRQVTMLLQGKHRQAVSGLKIQMEEAAEKLEFEQAAALRDRMLALENLGKKQLVTAGTMAHTDVIGYYQNLNKACFAVLHYVDGNLLDKEYEILPISDDPKEAVSALVKQYYLLRNCAPKEILLPYAMDDAQLFSDLLMQNLNKRVHIRTPQRGDGAALIKLANRNAEEEAERVTSKEEHSSGTLQLLKNMLCLDSLSRIESFDISNTAGKDIVASMVVFVDGKPLKRDYRRFRIRDLDNQNDYASMHQVIIRRFSHYVAQDRGFEASPDLLLIDGGAEHAAVAERALQELSLQFPVYGMVKDDRHRTRALITSEGREIGIQSEPSVFSLIGSIQEQTHNYAIEYHRSLRSRHLRESVLDDIPGIGIVRKKKLLEKFKTVSAIKRADIEKLCSVLTQKQAEIVYNYFHNQMQEDEI